MADISAKLVKELRERTGAGMMDCKKALVEAAGDMEGAEVALRKRGLSAAAKKASRATTQGLISSYIHPGAQIGVLVEVNCESDFVARTADFQELVHDLSMQIAASDPMYIQPSEVPEEILEKEREIARDRARGEGKPEKVLDRIVEGRLEKYYEDTCLLRQPFIKENNMTVEELIKSKIAKLGENITIARFVRYKIGDSTARDGSADGGAEA